MFILRIIFGETASEEACEKGFAKTKRKIEKGTLEGAVGEYSFSTEEDRQAAIEMLDDADGWMGTYWEKKNK